MHLCVATLHLSLKNENTMKGSDKKKKELKKAKSDITNSNTKGQSDYQLDKTRKSIIEPAVFKPKK